MADRALRRWSELAEAERDSLLAAYRETMEGVRSCDLAEKIAKMNRFLEPRGVILTEDDLRRR